MAKILIVDDEADARELLLRGLNRHGHLTTGAMDGAEALRLLDPTYDVLVTDLAMPQLDGLGLLRALPANNPGLIKLVITSFADKERAISALNLGVHYLVEKPFTAQQLADVIGKLLEERGQSSTIEQIFQLRVRAMPITERERQMVFYVLKGLPNLEIAGLLGIGEQSVKNYLSQLYRKLGVSSRSELFHLVFPI
jgi:DNA-binding NarL/FixJ family response regulator